ncbi:DUF4232 domain-containing protein [Streptacidiphilus sp. P02-A3a]|uniref:DUF4232 domain-containing protein n=1 Tax=Streptacidiphilus sp. P02-A3a TaxID=2704468 RepID=UPI0015FA11D5|nr:DUF4232 domain-containing protein [Streptacidiphilus sp. P02-A3a]QMU70254.1 DUF4232 domain-containing protein [Streptacidiphilus sp. P02-A3a]QMU70288.1 DUF4232 domain-containing protein [Streptacidiphilus sp. P02-A3a]
MKAHLRKSAALTTVVTALLVAGGVGTAVAAPRAAAAPQRCHTTALGASLRVPPNHVGMGNAYGELVLTNTSHQTCTVYGYPGLGLQNANHRVLPIRVKWGSTWFAADPRPHTVTLKPGQSAYANLAWNEPYGTKSVTPSYLEVTPPDETTFRLVRFAQGAINDGTLSVTALSARPVPLY